MIPIHLSGKSFYSRDAVLARY